MSQDSSFYVVISFLGFVTLFYIYGRKWLLAFLDSQIEVINEELQEANATKEMALAQLNAETKALIMIEQEEEKILNDAQKQSETLIRNIRQEISEEVAALQRECDFQMKKMKDKFEYEVKDQITDLLSQALITWMRKQDDTEIRQAANAYAVGLLEQVKI
jgi:F0F1-type ATP synthase membrane subunit b/b'